MQIHLFPRPGADTGIGLHWCAGRSQLPIQQIRAFWIPELKALGAAWVKINDHRDCLPLVEELLAAEIQPIVRLYRPAPYPSPLGGEELAAVSDLVRAGVRYIETGHRPDLPAQWRNGLLPPDAQLQVARHLAQDLAEVLERGGLAGIPAVDPAAEWDLLAEIIRLGRRDLLHGPIWQAIHTPGHNRPPNYPADIASTEGAPLTQSFYLTLADESWESKAWQDRSLIDVNRLRFRHSRQQQASLSENGSRAPEGFRQVALLHQRHLELLGRAIPILSTNGGFVVGAADDPGYPALTPSLHLAYTLEACRMMMGTSSRYPAAPDYFFCTNFWLLANQALSSSRPARENDAWYSPEHPQGVLPIVPVLQAEPKRLRHTPQVAGTERAPATTSADALGDSPVAAVGSGMIAGQVRGGASVDLRLVNLESGLMLQTIARSNGNYRFVDLPAGRYSVWVENPPGSHSRDVFVGDKQTVAVDLAVDGWGYEISEDPNGAGGMLQCSVALTADMASAPSLRLRWVGGERVLAMVRSGKDRIARCSAGPLEPGVYDLELLGLMDTTPGDLRATVPMGRTSETHVHFVYTRATPARTPASSVIEGRVVNGQTVQVVLQNEEGRRRSVTTDPKGGFRFAGLTPGRYSVNVPTNGQSLSRSRLGVDGENTLWVGFALPSPSLPAPLTLAELVGRAPGQAGRAAVLTGADGLSLSRRIHRDGSFHFTGLPAGAYRLVAGDFQLAGLALRERERVNIEFSPPTETWRVQVRSRTTLRRPGLVRVQVLGRSGAQVTLSGGAAGTLVRATGSASNYGPFAVEFGPLEPDDYTVTVQGIDAQALLHLDAGAGVVITFQRNSGLSSMPLQERVPLPISS